MRPTLTCHTLCSPGPPFITTFLHLFHRTMKVTLATTSAVTTKGAELKNFDLKASTTVEGFKVTCTAKPTTPSVSFDPVKLNTKPVSVDVNAEVSKNGVTVFFDNLQKLGDKKVAPRVKVEQKVTVSNKSYTIDAEVALKGNVKTSDVVTVTCKAPPVSGFTPKASYSTGPKGLSLTVSGDVNTDTNVVVKAEHFPAKSCKPTNVTTTLTQKLPEKMKVKLQLKQDLSGSVEVHKGNAFLEAPIGANGKPPGMRDVTFKFKKSFEYDL